MTDYPHTVNIVKTNNGPVEVSSMQANSDETFCQRPRQLTTVVLGAQSLGTVQRLKVGVAISNNKVSLWRQRRVQWSAEQKKKKTTQNMTKVKRFDEV